MQSIDRSSECARKLKPSDIFSHSYLVVCLFRKYKKEAFECQKWDMSFDILLEGRGKSITKWRKFLATFMGHIWSLWITRALTHFFGKKDEHKWLTWSFNNRNKHKKQKNKNKKMNKPQGWLVVKIFFSNQCSKMRQMDLKCVPDPPGYPPSFLNWSLRSWSVT